MGGVQIDVNEFFCFLNNIGQLKLTERFLNIRQSFTRWKDRTKTYLRPLLKLKTIYWGTFLKTFKRLNGLKYPNPCCF